MLASLLERRADETAVDEERRPVDVAGALGEEERHRVGELLGAAEAAGGNLLLLPLFPGGAGHAVLLGADIVQEDLTVGHEMTGEGSVESDADGDDRGVQGVMLVT